MSEDFTRRAVAAGIAAAPILASAAGALAQTATPPKRIIGLPSRQFQFTPSIDETIALAKRAGFDAIEWNVRDGGHVLPVNAERDLPRAVDATRKAGLIAEMTCTAIQDSQTPYAESILKAMKAVGIRHYRSSQYFRYDYAKPIQPQLDALKPRFASIAELNAKYGTTVCFHTHSGLGNIGGNVWDMWSVMKDFDPRLVAFNYDTAHTGITSGANWRQGASVARTHLAALALKDFNWFKGPPTATNYNGAFSEMVPVGEGLVDFRARFEYLRDLGFNGPINIHYEHHGMLLGDIGTAKLNYGTDEFLKLLKADLDAIRGYMRAAKFSA